MRNIYIWKNENAIQNFFFSDKILKKEGAVYRDAPGIQYYIRTYTSTTYFYPDHGVQDSLYTFI